MKTKILLILLFVAVLCPANLQAQQKRQYYYCEIVYSPDRLGSSLYINFGLDPLFNVTYSLTDASETTPLSFSNGIGAVNYLSSFGWRLLTTYTKSSGRGEALVYVMEFDASKNEPHMVTKWIDETVEQDIEKSREKNEKKK